MRIKETYIVYHKLYDEYVKLHYCLSTNGDKTGYYLERNSGKLERLDGVEFYELLEE
jgi:hypothetical protein